MGDTHQDHYFQSVLHMGLFFCEFIVVVVLFFVSMFSVSYRDGGVIFLQTAVLRFR